MAKLPSKSKVTKQMAVTKSKVTKQMAKLLSKSKLPSKWQSYQANQKLPSKWQSYQANQNYQANQKLPSKSKVTKQMAKSPSKWQSHQANGKVTKQMGKANNSPPQASPKDGTKSYQANCILSPFKPKTKKPYIIPAGVWSFQKTLGAFAPQDAHSFSLSRPLS